MKTGRAKSKTDVFKDTNTVCVSKQLKKNCNTEASGDKENQTDECQLFHVNESAKSECTEISKDNVKRQVSSERPNEKKKIVENVIWEGERRLTASDLTSKEPGEQYWKILAEKQKQALKDSLDENRMLHHKIDLLKQRNETLKQALQEATEVIELLNEIVAENEESEATISGTAKTESDEATFGKNASEQKDEAFGNDSTICDSDTDED